MVRPNPPPNTTETIRRRIRDAGLRATAARIAVLQELATAASPVTHAQMAEKLADSGHDRATIYRNLVELAEAGILSRIELGDHVWRFELRGAGEAGGAEHPHFVCVDCGEVSCLPNGSVSIQQDSGAKADSIGTVTAVLLKGHCNQCG